MELTQEQINNISKAFKELAKEIKRIFEHIAEVFMQFIRSIDFNKITKIMKAQGILIRTKSRRIKKKQISIINKLLE